MLLELDAREECAAHVARLAELVVNTVRRGVAFALLPQLTNVLRAAQPMVMFISRIESNRYVVSTCALGPDADAGEGAIKKFQEADEANQIDLASVYQRLANEHLAEVPELARILALKGITFP